MLRFTYQFAALSLVLLAAAPRSARADFSKYSCHPPATRSIAPIVDDNACVGFEIKADDGTVTKTVKFPFKGSGRMIASADGRTVVMLQSYLPGQADLKGNIVEDDTGSKNPIGMHVYRDGVRIRTHKISDVIKRKYLVSNSISHVDWIRDAPDTLEPDAFTITTTSFRVIKLDTKTGAILQEDDAPQWDRCDQIEAGKIDLPNGKLLSTYSLKTKKRATAIAFVADPNVALTNKASATACLERRGDELVLTELL